MSIDQEPQTSIDTQPEEERKKGADPFQELVSYLDELGLFDLGGVDQPLSIEDAKSFRESLSPEQQQRLAELEAAHSAS
jgi:hypothetical protein